MHHSYRIFCSWKWELISILLAIGLLTAITAILVLYDGEPAPDWGTQLNLNALIALLSTILRALLVVIVSQIICQQKWEWYSNKRFHPLSDLQQFDSGSRGSLGALLLIPTVVFKDAVTLIAATVLVASFLIGPFVQQASRTTTCLFPTPGLDASLSYAHYVPRRGGLSLGSIGEGATIQGSRGDALPDATVAILSSVTAPNGTENQIRGNCPTGTCTFRDANQEEAFPTYSVDDNSSTHSTVAMCDRCIDITSLVSRNYNSTAHETMFTLPNGINFTYTGASTFAIIRPSANLQWLGDLLTSELRAMSRWAYVNTTFLTVSGKHATLDKTEATAAVYLLYPCLRTYAASITENQLSEKEISSQVMELSVQLDEKVASSQVTDVSGELSSWWGRMSAQEQYEAHYAAVKSPCQVGGQVYDENLATTILPNATSLTLYNYNDPHQVTYRNISAPESCIYRHDVQFVNAISTFLNRDIFNGSCSWYKSNNCRKDRGIVPHDLSDLGVRMVLEKLIEGERAYANVTSWFTAFANAMTNRFRFQYGGAAFDASLPLWADQNLPHGEVQGLAWRTESCVAAHIEWLVLPICLTTITTLLMLWTIASNWRHRYIKPVWKNNILPLLFYRHNIDSENPGALPWQRDNVTEPEDRAQFTEASEMEKTAKGTLVTFQWSACEKLDDSLGKAGTSATALQHAKALPVQQSSHKADAEPLLASTGNDTQP